MQDIYIIDGCKVLFSIKPYLTHYLPHFRAYLLSERTDVQENSLYLSNLFVDTPVYISANLTFYRDNDLYYCHMYFVHFKCFEIHVLLRTISMSLFWLHGP